VQLASSLAGRHGCTIPKWGPSQEGTVDEANASWSVLFSRLAAGRSLQADWRWEPLAVSATG